MIPKFLALSFLLVIAVLPQQSSTAKNETHGMMNGRFWATMTDTAKLTYVVAALDTIRAIDLANGKVTLDSSPAYIYSPSLTNGEIQRELDAFYADAANAPVPIVSAMAWVSGKSRGDTKEQLDIKLSLLRKYSSNVEK